MLRVLCTKAKQERRDRDRQGGDGLVMPASIRKGQGDETMSEQRPKGNEKAAIRLSREDKR